MRQGRVLGDRRAYTLYPGGEDVALWYLLKQRDRRPRGEHGGVLLCCRWSAKVLRAVVLGGRCRRWNLDHWTRSLLLLLRCCQRIWW